MIDSVSVMRYFCRFYVRYDTPPTPKIFFYLLFFSQHERTSSTSSQRLVAVLNARPSYSLISIPSPSRYHLLIMQFFNNIFNNNNNNNNNNRNRRPQRRPNSRQSQSSQNNNNNPNNDNEQREPSRNPIDFLAQAAQAAQAAAQSAQAHMPQHHAHPQPPEPTRAAPPAATKTIRQLPTVSVTPEDLVDENNRECCICFEEHNIHDKVTRLPCAHIYHPSCITQWLVKHCTCPVCRYELPTDNVVYERERKERMKHRKPRYARYELDRMHSRELKKLGERLSINLSGAVEKQDFVDAILQSGKVIIIAAPEPVEYQHIELLRSMGVGQLKKAMADAGVFFDSRDVVEKEDMVQIFVNSGRIVLLEKEVKKTEKQGYGYVDVYGNAYGDNDDRGEEETKRPRIDEDASSMMSTTSGTDTAADTAGMDQSDDDHGDGSINGGETKEDDTKIAAEEEPEDDAMSNGATDAAVETTSQQEHVDVPAPDSEASAIEGEIHHRSTDHDSEPEPGPAPEPEPSPTNETPSFAKRSIADLRQLAYSLNVDLSGCIEKREMVELIMAAMIRAAGGPSQPSS